MDNLIFALALSLAAGLLFNRLAKLVGLPNVTGYLVAGLLLGGSVFNVIPFMAVDSLGCVSTVALGFIAFSIGDEFRLVNIRKLGSRVITVTCFQALMAVALVDIALILCGFPVSESITLGAISAATAPAATLMVVRQYKADGPVTRTLLPVVALDDAVCLVVFSISVSIAKTLEAGTGVSISAMLLQPAIEIVGSLLLGGAIGLVMSLCLRFFKSRANRLSLVICAVLMGTALADMLGLSSLLLCMMIGAMVANLWDDLEHLLDTVDHWTPPVFLLFFVLSGAGLDLSVLPKIGLMGTMYLVMRSLGKYVGSYIGCTITNFEPNVRKYLGITLQPQAGVAIGLCTLAAAELPQYGSQIRTVILCATLVYELVGPVLTKISLTKAGEIKPEKG